MNTFLVSSVATSYTPCYYAFNVYCRELAPGTVSLTGDSALGDDSKHFAYRSGHLCSLFITCVNSSNMQQER